MLDISRKFTTYRMAIATSKVCVAPSTIQRIQQGTVHKGNPLEVAKVASIQAAKQTATILPYCHPIPIEFVQVEFELGVDSIVTSVTVKSIAKTGVEMEALTAASVAALTLYDMLKMYDETMSIVEVKLIEKQGGKSDFRESFDRQLTAAVLVMSDSIASGKKSDSSGKEIVARLIEQNFEIRDYVILPDDTDKIIELIQRYCDDLQLDLVVTTGGTGFSPRDHTPEAMEQIFERNIPGIPEAIRAYGQSRTPYSMLSRSKAGLRGKTLILNLPGSRKGVSESLDALFPGLLHAFPMIWGVGSWKEKKQ